MRTDGFIFPSSAKCFVLVRYSHYLSCFSLSFCFMSVFTLTKSLGALEPNFVTAIRRKQLYQLFS